MRETTAAILVDYYKTKESDPMGLFDKFKKKPATPPRPMPLPMRPGMVKPDPRAENHFIIIILDSCRYDAFMSAETKTIAKLSGGKVEKRYTYASWTAPSYNLLTGLLPHTSPENVYASEYYKEDFYSTTSAWAPRAPTSTSAPWSGPGYRLLQQKLGYDTQPGSPCRC